MNLSARQQPIHKTALKHRRELQVTVSHCLALTHESLGYKRLHQLGTEKISHDKEQNKSQSHNKAVGILVQKPTTVAEGIRNVSSTYSLVHVVCWRLRWHQFQNTQLLSSPNPRSCTRMSMTPPRTLLYSAP